MQKLFLAPISMNMYRYNLRFPLSKKCNIIRVGGEGGGRTSNARWIMHDIFINRFQVLALYLSHQSFKKNIIEYDIFQNWSSTFWMWVAVNRCVWFHSNVNPFDVYVVPKNIIARQQNKIIISFKNIKMNFYWTLTETKGNIEQHLMTL